MIADKGVVTWFVSRLAGAASPGWRLRVFVTGLLGGWIGIWFVAGWWCVHYPNNHQFGVGEEPAPDWLWQLGLGGIAFGAALLIALAIAGPSRLHDTPKAVHEPSTVVLIWVVFGCSAVPILVSAIAAHDSRYRGNAIFLVVAFVAMATGFQIWTSKPQAR